MPIIKWCPFSVSTRHLSMYNLSPVLHPSIHLPVSAARLHLCTYYPSGPSTALSLDNKFLLSFQVAVAVWKTELRYCSCPAHLRAEGWWTVRRTSLRMRSWLPCWLAHWGLSTRQIAGVLCAGPVKSLFCCIFNLTKNLVSWWTSHVFSKGSKSVALPQTVSKRQKLSWADFCGASALSK